MTIRHFMIVVANPRHKRETYQDHENPAWRAGEDGGGAAEAGDWWDGRANGEADGRGGRCGPGGRRMGPDGAEEA